MVCLTAMPTLSPIYGDDFWSFAKPEKPDVPSVQRHDWVQNPVDAFVLARLEGKGLKPSAPAKPGVLLRRATFDVTGLPPTPEERAVFSEDVERLGDDRAYAKLVERLLASPSYGERWGQHWLDVVRYADSDGFEYDDPRPHAWRYRDWVIAALNADKPYDEFVREQIAGDEIAAISKDTPRNETALVATGLHRLGPLRLNAGMQDEEKNRQEVLVEMTDTVGSAFLALTIGCARCHDHRFDPIPQEDYYRLQAFFAATEAKNISLVSNDERSRYDTLIKTFNDQQRKLQQKVEALEKPHREKIIEVRKAKLPIEVRTAFATPEEERSERQGALVAEFGFMLGVSTSDVIALLSNDERTQHAALKDQLAAHELTRPTTPPGIMAVAEKGTDAPPTYVLRRGVPGRHGAQVEPIFPSAISFENSPPPPVLTSTPVESSPPPSSQTTGRRTALADWLTSKNHPLTARVFVNRLWQHHFVAALVTTPNDFGVMGEYPTHPKLLDWLAVQLMDGGWSIKQVHRLLLLSATYRQSSAAANAEAPPKADRTNRLLWSMRRRRLEGESLRDAILATSGALNLKRGGPGVRLNMGREMTAQIYKGAWRATPEETEQSRRSVYTFVKRNLRLPFFRNFDAPDTITSCAQRTVSTHAGQALTLLNGEFTDAQSQLFTERILQEIGVTDRSQVDDDLFAKAVRRAFEIALIRQPNDNERELGKQFLSDQVELIRKESPQASNESAFTKALADYCLVLFNLDEFLFID